MKIEESALLYLQSQTIQVQSFKVKKRCPQWVVKLAAQSERLHSEDQPRQEGCAFDKCLANRQRSPERPVLRTVSSTPLGLV
jgi:hypothetical protein